MEVTALTYEGEITATTPLNLSSFEQNEFSDSLPEIWEEVYKSTLPEPKIKITNQKWVSIFPWLLGILGIIVIIIAVSMKTRFTPKTKYQKTKKSGPIEDINDVSPGFWHQPKEKIDEALPFEIEQRKK